MARAELILSNSVGLHARPAAIFAKQAATYDSRVTVTCGDRSADASSLLGVLKLEATQGSRVVIEADGPDADAAVSELVELLGTLE